MKCFEVSSSTNSTHKAPFRPIQFACKHNRSTEDAKLTPLHNAYTHLEKTGSFVRILFINFSSAFNTTQPQLMASKLLKFDINPRLILWIVNFLVNRFQTVHHHAVLSSSCSISTDSPQGTVLSPILFTLYWVVQQSWYARVNALRNLSRKTREVAAHFQADFWVGTASCCV